MMGLIGLLLLALALGSISMACWRFGTHMVSRWLPLTLTLAYYVALYLWPHYAIRATLEQLPYPETEQVRPFLMGLALFVGAVEIISYAARLTRENQKLKGEKC